MCVQRNAFAVTYMHRIKSQYAGIGRRLDSLVARAKRRTAMWGRLFEPHVGRTYTTHINNNIVSVVRLFSVSIICFLLRIRHKNSNNNKEQQQQAAVSRHRHSLIGHLEMEPCAWLHSLYSPLYMASLFDKETTI